jgi:magnesium transporter
MQSLIVAQDGIFRTDLPPTQLGEALANPAAIIWLDIQDPADEDIALLRDGFGFHPLAIEDIIHAQQRPKVDAYGITLPRPIPESEVGSAAGQRTEPAEPLGPGQYYFIVFYAAGYDQEQGHIETKAINLFIGSHYLVTVHAGPSLYVSGTLERWRAPNSPFGRRIGALVYALLDAIVDDYFPIMDRVAERVEELEDTIFARFNESAIEMIFDLKRDLLSLRRVVAPEREVINVLLRRDLPAVRSKDVVYLQDIYDHLVRVIDNIDTYRDLLSNALDSYLSLQSNKLNQIVKLLTIGSILLMSMALIAGIYGMNFKYMPELSQPWGYPWALGLMVVVSTGLILFFRRQKWL